MVTAQVSEETAGFLATVMPAIVGTLRGNGAVKLTPAWYEYREGCFWLSTRRGSHWLDQIERDKAATLLLIDPADSHRVVHAETSLVRTTTEGALEQVNRLSLRYEGRPYALKFPQQRVTIQLAPVHIRSTLDWRPARRRPA